MHSLSRVPRLRTRLHAILVLLRCTRMHFPFVFVSLFPLAYLFSSVGRCGDACSAVRCTFLVFPECAGYILTLFPRLEFKSFKNHEQKCRIKIEIVLLSLTFMRAWWCTKTQTIAVLCWTMCVCGRVTEMGNKPTNKTSLILLPETSRFNQQIRVNRIHL